MGHEYVSDLNHTNTLRELNRKLSLFMRVKWTECAGRIISFGSKPKFADFLKHLKDRAALVNNEFGEDLNAAPSKERENVNRRDQRGRNPRRLMSLFGGVRGRQGNGGQNQTMPACTVSRGQHGLWRCDKFKKQSHQDSVDSSQLNQEGTRSDTNSETSVVTGEGAAVTAATGAGERVCLSVVPVKVLAKGSNLIPVETFALLDSGSEVTLSHEKLRETLGASGPKLQEV